MAGRVHRRSPEIAAPRPHRSGAERLHRAGARREDRQYSPPHGVLPGDGGEAVARGQQADAEAERDDHRLSYGRGQHAGQEQDHEDRKRAGTVPDETRDGGFEADQEDRHGERHEQTKIGVGGKDHRRRLGSGKGKA